MYNRIEAEEEEVDFRQLSNLGQKESLCPTLDELKIQFHGKRCTTTYTHTSAQAVSEFFYLTQMSLERCQRFASLSLLSRNKSQRKERLSAEVMLKLFSGKKKGIRKVSRFYLAQGMDMTSYLISYLYPKNVDICQSQDAILGKAQIESSRKCMQ